VGFCRTLSAACPGIRGRIGPPGGIGGTPSVCGAPLAGRISSGSASGRVIVPGPVPGMVTAWRAGCGWGPRADLLVAVDRPARYSRVRLRVLQAPHRICAHADHVVARPPSKPGGLDPGDRGVPGTVPLGWVGPVCPAGITLDGLPGPACEADVRLSPHRPFASLTRAFVRSEAPRH
jgi:hypothetical protein